jgi:hypothetical protein
MNLKEIMHRAISGGAIESKYICVPHFALLRMSGILIFIETLIFICFAGAFRAAAVMLACVVFPYFYRLYLRIWKKFYSPRSLHLLALLSAVPCYFTGAAIRLILYKLIIPY